MSSPYRTRETHEAEQAARIDALRTKPHPEIIRDVFDAQWALLSATATRIDRGESIDPVAFADLCAGIASTARCYQHARAVESAARIERDFPVLKVVD